MEHLEHPWRPVYNADSRLLILGTFPSPRSRAEGFYFGHPQNRFWEVLADSLRVSRLPAGADKAKKTYFLLENRVALWDVLHSCDIEGASDASIRNPVANGFCPIIEASRIETVFATGRTATGLFNRLAARETGMRAVYLPSTSPANRAQQLRPEFAGLWASIGRVLRGELVSAAGMKAADRRAIEEGVPSLTLMERAAQVCVDELLAVNNGFDLSSVLCACGAGNNGGDGFAIARLLRQRNVSVEVLFVGDREKLSAETRQQEVWAREAGVRIVDLADRDVVGRLLPAATGASQLADRDAAGRQPPSTVVDALFGIGLARELVGEYLRVVRLMNRLRLGGARVLAVDIPSGICADSGEVLGDAVRAHLTATFACNKLGLTLNPGREHAGQVLVHDIGIRVD
ncbi:MAG: NAD(P)H-hydrate epimerase [Coriobacteriales bacterium]|jgi:hypoxanthine-DNA glycosylase|nr:NAD(P)H-hydrate epimerase [Coriobacteriales bacterium]